MAKNLILFSFLFWFTYCGNEMYVEIPSNTNNQPIRDLVDNDKTNSNTNIYREQSSLSGTTSSGAVGGPTSGAVGTPPGSSTTGGPAGNYSGNPTTWGY